MKVMREGKREGKKKIKKKKGKKKSKLVTVWIYLSLELGVGRRKQHKRGSAWNDLKRASLLMRPEITEKLIESIKSHVPSDRIFHDQRRKQLKSHEQSCNFGHDGVLSYW